MAGDLETFHADLHQQIQLDAHASGKLLAEAFLDHFAEVLQDEGEIVTFDAARFDNNRGVRIDG